MRKISNKGLELIQEFEGFSSVAYLCPAKIPTIGYGNTFWEDGRKVRLGEQISKTKALELLEFVANRDFANKIFPLIKVEVSQNQFVNFSFCLGIKVFVKVQLLAFYIGQFLIRRKFYDSDLGFAFSFLQVILMHYQIP